MKAGVTLDGFGLDRLGGSVLFLVGHTVPRHVLFSWTPHPLAPHPNKHQLLLKGFILESKSIFLCDPVTTRL